MELVEIPETAPPEVMNDSQTEDRMLSETTRLTIPASADADEAAAIAAAVGVHLRDCAEARAVADDAPASCNRWKLRGRLGGRKLPREVARGDEWKAAARSR